MNLGVSVVLAWFREYGVYLIPAIILSVVCVYFFFRRVLLKYTDSYKYNVWDKIFLAVNFIALCYLGLIVGVGISVILN